MLRRSKKINQNVQSLIFLFINFLYKSNVLLTFFSNSFDIYLNGLIINARQTFTDKLILRKNTQILN